MHVLDHKNDRTEPHVMHAMMNKSLSFEPCELGIEGGGFVHPYMERGF